MLVPHPDSQPQLRVNWPDGTQERQIAISRNASAPPRPIHNLPRCPSCRLVSSGRLIWAAFPVSGRPFSQPASPSQANQAANRRPDCRVFWRSHHFLSTCHTTAFDLSPRRMSLHSGVAFTFRLLGFNEKCANFSRLLIGSLRCREREDNLEKNMIDMSDRNL